MAMIKCPECGNMISNMAHSCPHCGCPSQNMIFKSKFYFEVDENIDDDCFPIILEVGTCRFSIDSSSKGKGRICAGEVSSKDVSAGDNGLIKIQLTSTVLVVSDDYTDQRTQNYNNFNVGHDCLFVCTAKEWQSRGYYEDYYEDYYAIGIEIAGSFLS